MGTYYYAINSKREILYLGKVCLSRQVNSEKQLKSELSKSMSGSHLKYWTKRLIAFTGKVGNSLSPIEVMSDNESRYYALIQKRIFDEPTYERWLRKFETEEQVQKGMSEIRQENQEVLSKFNKDEVFIEFME